MGRIRVLSDEVASQVAAGEVVERPASLVKELVENSIDAGAEKVVVEYARGGSRLVAVTDDGCGMDGEDAVLCLERHATSKIRTGNDLAGVLTMGFRGEALPSIASVSRFRLVTRERDAAAGTEVIVVGGKREEVRAIGAPPGTRIEVKDLFFNLPARRKFLRGEETEAAHIVQGLHAMALAHPGVALECRRDGVTQLSLPRAGDLAVRIVDLFGPAHLERLVAIDPVEAAGFSISGFLAAPGQGRRDRLQQFVILNGRPIVCPAVQQPLREAYAGAMERGHHPLSVLVITMRTELVDCNVHPAKREVRLRNPEALRQAVFDAGRQALARARHSRRAGAARPAFPFPAGRDETFSASTPDGQSPGPAGGGVAPADHPPAVAVPPAAAVELPVAPLRDRAEGVFRPTAPQPELGPGDGPGTPPSQSLPPDAVPSAGSRAVPVSPATSPEDRFRYLGLAGEGYLVLEGDEGLVLVDTRASAERIHFESLLRQIEEGEAPSQRLLLPVMAELPVREHAWVCDHLDELRAAGFFLEPFGGSTLKIEGVPTAAGRREPRDLLHDLAASLRAAGRLTRGRALREALARSVSRLAAEDRFQGGEERARRLMRELLRCELPYASPAGRPTMIQFSFAELGRKFGRT